MEEERGGREVYIHACSTPTADSTGQHQWIRNRNAGERASDSFDLYIPPCLAGMKGEGAGRVRGTAMRAHLSEISGVA